MDLETFAVAVLAAIGAYIVLIVCVIAFALGVARLCRGRIQDMHAVDRQVMNGEFDHSE